MEARLPLVVALPTRPPGLPQDYDAVARAAWVDGNQEFAAESTRGKVIEVEDTGHDIHVDQPEVVIDAIRDVRDYRERPAQEYGARSVRSREASFFWSRTGRSASRVASAARSASNAPSTAVLPSRVSRTITPRRSAGSG